MMRKKFRMSSFGEMTFFLGLQVKQDSTGILIHHGKYVDDVLSKFKFNDCKSVDTPMAERPVLSSDPEGEAVDPTFYAQ